MAKKTKFYILFFVVLVVGFYLALKVFVPGVFDTQINPIGQVRSFQFINQDGQTVTEKNIAGKVTAVEYFFTTCKGICPRLNKNLKTVYEEFKNDPGFMILSHTSDPEVDNPDKLKAHAASMGVNTDKWVFLTGRKDSLYNMARFSYKIDDPANNLKSINDDFLHTQFIALVNKKGDVVKVYDGLKISEMKDMAGQIRKLLKE